MNVSTCTTDHETYISQEILFEILTRVPVKSILRFRCVSKLFYSLTTQPFFTDVYRNRSLTRPSGTSILFSLPSPTHKQVFYTVNYTEENQGKLQANHIQYLLVQCFQNMVHSNYVDGLVCLSNNNGDVMICNISTRQYISLPKLNSRPAFARAILGFDSVSKRYKVLKSEMCYDCQAKKHWVLTLGEDKSWREINWFQHYYDDSVHINGVIYFIHLKNTKPGIVIFDVGTESFHKITLPNELGYCLQPIRLSRWTEINGQLAFINIHYTGQRCSVEIWSLQKSMDWEKHMVQIPLEESKIIKKAYSMNLSTNRMGEIVWLLQDSRSTFILFYSFQRRVWRKFEILGLHDHFISFENFRGVMQVIEENVCSPHLMLKC